MVDGTLIKETGATFTPPGLANFLARQIFENLDVSDTTSRLSILDPACGDGQLLCAIYDVLKKQGMSHCHLNGYDSNPQFLKEAKSTDCNGLRSWKGQRVAAVSP